MKLKRKVQKKEFVFRKLFLLVNLASWLGLAAMVIFVSPDSGLIIAAFLSLLFLVIVFSLWQFLKSWLISLLLGFYLTIVLILKLFAQLHVLNVILLSGFFLVIFFEFRKKRQLPQKPS